MRAILILALAVCLIIPSVHAVSDYLDCLNCFYANRTAYYFCQSTRQCLPLRSQACPQSQMVTKKDLCLNGFQACTNVTFTQYSVGQTLTSGYSLAPGTGCYIQINRLNNGSTGSLAVSYSDPTSIMVFDKT